MNRSWRASDGRIVRGGMRNARYWMQVRVGVKCVHHRFAHLNEYKDAVWEHVRLGYAIRPIDDVSCIAEG